MSNCFAISREQHEEVDDGEEEVDLVDGFSFAARSECHIRSSPGEVKKSKLSHNLFWDLTNREQVDNGGANIQMGGLMGDLENRGSWAAIGEEDDMGNKYWGGGEEEEGEEGKKGVNNEYDEEEDDSGESGRKRQRTNLFFNVGSAKECQDAIERNNNVGSAKECQDALEKLAAYVVQCGGKRNLLVGWQACRFPSGHWVYHTANGNRFQSRADVARWLKLPRAPAFWKPSSTVTNIASVEECDDALERLASYVVQCGGHRRLIRGWRALRIPSGCWSFHTNTGNRFENRPAVARWLKLPGAPLVGQAGGHSITNIASARECEDALRKLASYIVECGGFRHLVSGWKSSRMPSGCWSYHTEKGHRFQSRAAVARHLKLPGAPPIRIYPKRKKG
jgi:hypothetical protein